MTREEAKEIIKSECYVFNPLNFDRTTRINTALDVAVEALEQKPILDKIRAEIAEYGSICVAYTITDKTKTDEGIEKLVSDVLKQAKEQVLDIIDKYKAEMENEE